MPRLFKKLRKKRESESLPYLDRIDKLEKVDIIRLKGLITQIMIPTIEARIKENRRKGEKIDRNLIIDFANVEDVDTSTVAFHIVHLNEYHEKGFEIGFININAEMKGLLNLFRENENFKVFTTEAEAVKALNR